MEEKIELKIEKMRDSQGKWSELLKIGIFEQFNGSCAILVIGSS